MSFRRILRLLGLVLLFEAVMMVPPMLVALASHGPDTLGFLFSALLCGAAGIGLTLIPQSTKRPLQPREGYCAVAVCWLGMAAFGMLPFLFSGALPRVTDAWFESVSGFTTTSVTLFADVEKLPNGILLWRSLTNWMGGLGIVAITIVFLTQLGTTGGQVLLRAESTGPMKGKIVPKLGHTAQLMLGIYLALTGLLILILILLGVPALEAFIHGLCTVATGSFSNKSDSIAAYHGTPVSIVLAVFMLLSGVNFGMYAALIHGQWRKVLRNEELRVYIGLILAGTAIIAINARGVYQGVLQAIPHAGFQVVSMITTSGFSTQDYIQWPELSKNLLIALTLIGGCAGSTAGGFKVVRLLMISKTIRREVAHIVHPRMVRSVKLDGKPVQNEALTATLVFTATLFLLIVGGTLVLSLDGLDFATTLTAVVGCVSNVGNGLSLVGPLGNYAAFSGLGKTVLTILMLFGRLEIFPLLMLLSLLLRGKKSGGFA